MIKHPFVAAIIFSVFSLTNLFTLKAQDIYIRSLKYYAGKNQTAFPVLYLRNHKTTPLRIQFDIEADTQPDLNIVFRFCDKNWTPYSNLLLQNDGYNIEHNLWFTSLPTTVEKARYHYRGRFPNKNVNFPFPGKWQFYITDSQDTSIIYEWGKFIVAEQTVPLRISMERNRLEGKISDNSELDRVFNLDVNFDIPDSLYPSRIEYIEIIENQKVEYPVKITKDNYVKNRYWEWNGSNEFKFVANDIKPGNEYRETNLLGITWHMPPTTYANVEKIDYSRFYKFGKRDLNGGFKLKNYKNQYATYMNTIFQFEPPNPVYNDIFLVGAFTNWEVLPDFKMDNNNGIYSIDVELKRGVYDYQYVSADIDGDEITNIDWFVFEGNFWETQNVYNIFLYYKTTDLGGYDKIIGFKRIVSRNL